MCANRKQFLTTIALISVLALTISAKAAPSAGGVALGDSDGGVTDRAYVMAPPDYQYVVERDSGSFLDCGEGM
ncbi:MAG TPA: hypothetical protein VNH64_09570, partial [Parvularculaceae bacterium]|nr:hypothetical protein [Parvularculaceae bacterium]